MRTSGSFNINSPEESFPASADSPSPPAAKRAKTDGEPSASGSQTSGASYTDRATRHALLAKIQGYSYQAKPLPGMEAVHHQNVANVLGCVEAFIEEFVAEHPAGTAKQISDGISRDMGRILKDAQLDISCYPAVGPGKAEYGKHLIFSSQTIPLLKDAPLCFQLFHFDPGQTTPIHNHPNPDQDPTRVVMVECGSNVIDGTVNERLYDRHSNPVEKISKEHRDAGNWRVMDNPGKNPAHSIKNPTDKPATTVHAYTMDGISEGHTVAVQSIFTRPKGNTGAVRQKLVEARGGQDGAADLASPVYAARIERLKSSVSAITARELASGLEKESVVVFDVRRPKERSGGVIPNAQRVPVEVFETKSRLHLYNHDAGKTIVIYSGNDGDYRALVAAEKLMAMGYSNVKYLEGGYQSHVDHGSSPSDLSTPAM